MQLYFLTGSRLYCKNPRHLPYIEPFSSWASLSLKTSKTPEALALAPLMCRTPRSSEISYKQIIKKSFESDRLIGKYVSCICFTFLQFYHIIHPIYHSSSSFCQFYKYYRKLFWGGNTAYLKGVNPCCNNSSLISSFPNSGYGATMSYILVHSCAHKLPKICAGKGPLGLTTSGP